MSKMEEEAYNLIEEMALNNFQWSSERAQPKRVGGKFELDAITLLTAKMDAMTQKLDKLNVHAVESCAPSPLCARCGSFEHVAENCPVGNPLAPSILRMFHMLIISNPGRPMTHIPIHTTLMKTTPQFLI